MANIIESIGYSWGKTHAGVIAYFCDIYCGGDTQPLTSLFNELNVTIPSEPIPIREYNLKGIRVDLAIFDGKLNRENNKPCIIIEIKVDDHESSHNNIAQTELYADATPNIPNSDRLFITFGNGEYFAKPHDPRFRWVKLPEIASAIQNANIRNPKVELLNDWNTAIKHELDRRNDVSNNNKGNIKSYRQGAWNIIFLGQLKEALINYIANMNLILEIEAFCYTRGSEPDTILNFGCEIDNIRPRFAEINNNGKLNMKITFQDYNDKPNRDILRKQKYDDYKNLLSNHLLTNNKPIKNYNPGSETMTLTSFDIGLINKNGGLEYVNDQDYTIQELIKYLKIIY